MSSMKNVTNKPDFEVDLVRRVSEVFLGSRDFKKLAEESVNLITTELKDMGIIGAALFRVNKEKDRLDGYAYSSRAFRTVEKLLPLKFSSLSVSFSEKDNLLIKALTTNSVQEGNMLRDFTYPTLTHTASTAVQKVIGMSYLLAYPLRLKAGKAEGGLLIGLKNEEPTKDQRIILETFRLQLELAFENVYEFEKLLERHKRNMAKAHDRSHGEDIPTIRFTLRITPNQNALLEKHARKEGVDKTAFIRSLIDDLKDAKKTADKHSSSKR